MADVTPVQTGDGSQPVSAGTFHVGNFGPSPTPDIRTNVAAPLDVRGAPGQAAFLAQQLQQSLQSMRFPMMEVERIQGMQHARSMESQGEADATAGTINPQTMQADRMYRQGAMHITVTKQYLQWAPQEAQKLQSDPNYLNLTPQQMMGVVDADARKAFGGLENDPSAAPTLAPLLTHFQNEVLGRHIQSVTTQNYQTQMSNIGSLALGAAVHGVPFDFNAEVTRAAAITGNRGVARADAVNAVMQTAVANGNAAILNTIVPAPGQKALAPREQLLIQQARQRIMLQQRPVEQQQDRAYQSEALTSILNGGDARLAVNRYLAKTPTADPSFIPKAMSFANSLSTEASTAVATGSDAADLTAAVVKGDIKSPSDLLSYVDNLGVSGKARQQLMTEGLSTMSKVHSSMTSNPYYRNTLAGVEMRYKPKTPLPGMAADPGAVAQYSGAMSDFSQEYAGLVQQGKSPAQAAYTAEQNVSTKWGDPRNALANGGTYKAPRTDGDMVGLLLNNPKAAQAAGVGKADLARLWQTGQLTPAQMEAIGRAYLNQ